MKGRGVDEHIFILSTLVDDALRNNRKLYCCTIDLRRAFPSVNRAKLFLKLVEIGAPRILIRALFRLYKYDCFSIIIDGMAGSFQDANRGIRE